MAVKHSFVSGRPDNGDAGAIQPSQWDADHQLDGILAAIDTLAAAPSTVMTFDGSANFQLLPFASFAPIYSPAFTGVPTAPTAAAGVNSSQIATTAYVTSAITTLIGGAPGALNTLNELATAINDDTNFAGTVTAALGVRLRVDTASQGLSGGQQSNGRANLGLGTAATLNSGTSAGNVVVLDGSGKLPAVDGSQLTSIAPSGSVRYDISQSLTAAQQTQARVNIGIPTVMRDYIAGLAMTAAGSSSSLSVAAGVAADSTNANILVLPAMSKTTSAWNAGNTLGGLDTGTIAPNTWYHWYVIKSPSLGATDLIFSATATPSSGPASMPNFWTLFRRIGSAKTDGSSQWVAFTQFGDEFLWNAPVGDVNVSTLSTTATLFPLTVPPGVKVTAKLRGHMTHATGGTGVLVNSPDETQVAVNTPTGNRSAIYQGGGVACPLGELNVRTDTNQNVRAISSAASTTLVMATVGYTDRRGRDA
jgi:hypothetical protein